MPEIVQEIGAYAGLASVLGLAVLSALYFSQARDVKRLREWAGRAPERSEQGTPAVPGRVVGQPQQPSAPAGPAPPVPGQPPEPAAPARQPAKPATPAGQPATPTPATPAGQPPKPATPAGQPPKPADQPAPAAAAAAGARPATAQQDKPAGAPVPAGQNTNAASATPSAAPPAPSPPKPVSPAPQPARPAAGPPPRQGAPATAAASRGGAPSVPAGGQRFASRPGVTSRHSPQETAILPPRPTESWYSRLGVRYLAIVLAGVLVLGGAAAYGISQLTGDDAGGTGGERQAAPGGDDAGEGSGQPNRRQGAAVRPANVTVAVLNGTTVPGLAATLSDEVLAAGFKVGTITNFSDQQLAESVVQYAPGHEPEARAVSRRLGITQREPVNPASQALAGDATVIVIAGSDKSP